VQVLLGAWGGVGGGQHRTASRIACIIGTSSGTAASADLIVSTSVSNSVHSTLALFAKYRKNVRSLTPASAVICSMVVFSKPRSVNSRSAISGRAAGQPGKPRSRAPLSGPQL
jgi:hypothetical protein